jgi:predicted nucleotidyltransferase
MPANAMRLDYRSIFEELNKERIDYVVVGGLAVNFHGIPRMTYDMDLMIALEPENITRLVSKLTGWGYRPRVPVDPRDLADEEKRRSWILKKNMKAFTFYSGSEAIAEIDILIDPPISYEELRDRAVVFDIEGVSVPVVSVFHLIEMKMKSGRQQDLSDIEHLKIILEQQ